MGYNVLNSPQPDDIWGLDALSPDEQSDWAKEKWGELIAGHNGKIMLLQYAPSAERLTLRCLRKFFRFGREKEKRIYYFAPHSEPLLPRLTKRENRLYVIHGASRFLNLKEWLTTHSKEQSSILILTVANDELASLPKLFDFFKVGVPQVEDLQAERYANGIIERYTWSLSEDNTSMWSFLRLLAEAGKAGVSMPLELVSRMLNLEYKELLFMLARPEVCDFIRLSQEGKLTQRQVSFRGAWLAQMFLEKTGNPGYKRLLEALEFVNQKNEEERRFMLNLLVALKAQGFGDTVYRLKKQFHNKVHDSNHLAKKREALAWFIFMHKGLLYYFLVFFYSIEEKLKLMFTHKPHILEF